VTDEERKEANESILRELEFVKSLYDKHGMTEHSNELAEKIEETKNQLEKPEDDNG